MCGQVGDQGATLRQSYLNAMVVLLLCSHSNILIQRILILASILLDNNTICGRNEF